MDQEEQSSKFSGWCFQNAWPHQYFPFPGAEEFVPPRKEGRPQRDVFAWGPNGIRWKPQFTGYRSGPLKGKMKKVYYWIRNAQFEHCVFSFSPATALKKNAPNKTIYVYARQADGSHFVDNVGIYDIYLAIRLADIQRAFPQLDIN